MCTSELYPLGSAHRTALLEVCHLLIREAASAPLRESGSARVEGAHRELALRGGEDVLQVGGESHVVAMLVHGEIQLLHTVDYVRQSFKRLLRNIGWGGGGGG